MPPKKPAILPRALPPISVAECAADSIVERLTEAGFEAYRVGGAVRDRLMGRVPEEVDVATDAPPTAVQELFSCTYAVGAAFGVIVVHSANGCDVEVATFRKESGYADGRHPAEVHVSDASTDAHRRDFTVNALYYDPSEHHVLDFVGGLEDLRDGGLRAIGCPVERFAEDYLRMLRAVRFAAELGFELDPDTRAAIPPLAHRLANISAERVFDELTKMLTGRDPASAFTLLLDLGLLTVWLPELTRMSGIPQPEQFHPEGDVWEHTRLALTCLRGASAAVAWSALLHDVGKPPTLGYHDNGVPRFHGHARVGADVASGILRRFRTSTKLRKQVAATVNNHMTFSDVQHMRPAKLRRLIGRENFPLELELHRIDCMASHAKVDNYVFLLDKLAEFANEPVLPSPLLDGRDLMTAGVPQGPAVGRLLARLRELQLDGEIRTREQALAWLTHKTE